GVQIPKGTYSCTRHQGRQARQQPQRRQRPPPHTRAGRTRYDFGLLDAEWLSVFTVEVTPTWRPSARIAAHESFVIASLGWLQSSTWRPLGFRIAMRLSNSRSH